MSGQGGLVIGRFEIFFTYIYIQVCKGQRHRKWVRFCSGVLGVSQGVKKGLQGVSHGMYTGIRTDHEHQVYRWRDKEKRVQTRVGTHRRRVSSNLFKYPRSVVSGAASTTEVHGGLRGQEPTVSTLLPQVRLHPLLSDELHTVTGNSRPRGQTRRV